MYSPTMGTVYLNSIHMYYGVFVLTTSGRFEMDSSCGMRRCEECVCRIKKKSKPFLPLFQRINSAHERNHL